MRKTAYLFIVTPLLLIFFYSGCIDLPKDTVAPTWPVELNVPIIDTTYFLSDIIKTDRNIVDSAGTNDSLYFLTVNNLENSSAIQDSLKMSGSIFPKELNVTNSNPNVGGKFTSSLIYLPDPDYHLDTAEFKSGSFGLILANNSDGPVNYEFIFPGFKNRVNGSRLSTSGTLTQNETRDVKLPVKDFTYTELPITGFDDLITYKEQSDAGFFIIAKVQASGSNINVNFKSNVKTDQITLSRVVGKLKTTRLPYDEKSYQTQLGDDIQDMQDKVDFKHVKLRLRMKTYGAMKNIKIRIDSLTVTGLKKNGANPVKLKFNGKSYYKDELIAGNTYERVFDETNSNLIQFLLNMPKEIIVGSKYTIEKNETGSYSGQVVSDHDSIKFIADIVSPLIIAARDAQYLDTTFISDQLSEEDKDNITKGNKASLILEVSNKIPLGITAKVTFYDKFNQKLFAIRNTGTNSTVEQVEVGPAPVNSNGIPTGFTTSRTMLVLDKSEFEKFRNSHYMIVDLRLRTTGSTPTAFGNYVQIRSRDFVKVKIGGGVNYNIDLSE